MIRLIVASTSNGVIGIGDKIPWHYSEDMKWFKDNTMNGVLIVGRKTFETLPKKMPGRSFVVMTRNDDYRCDHITSPSLMSALHACKVAFSDKPVWIIGGGEVYKQAFDLNVVDEVYLTIVPDNVDHDVNDVVMWPIDKLKDDFINKDRFSLNELIVEIHERKK